MFARASLVALALASPAWADPDYPAGLFERSPLNGPPAAVSRRGHNPPRKRKTRPASAPAAPAIIIASGGIRGRNHADPLFQRRVRERVSTLSTLRDRKKNMDFTSTLLQGIS